MFGGSFNPIHVGHLFLAEDVRLRLGYDKVFFIPVSIPAHKKLASGASDKNRLQMTKLAVQGNPSFEVDDCEIRRGGVSYSYDTLIELIQRMADDLEGKIGLVMGDDLVEGFSEWKNAKELSEKADLILARRVAGYGIQPPVFNYPHIELSNSILPVASSDIRQRISAGIGKDCLGAWRYLVPEAVYQYIIQRNLYGFRTN